jgi:amidase
LFADEIAYMSALEIALRIRRRQFSPVEVVEAFIQRVEERNPSINALVYFGFDDARSNAKAAEQALLQGDELGPLHGVPVVIKDNFDHKPGWVSTLGGVRALKNFVADTHCIFAERIEKAGAIILGKTNSPSLGFRGTCDNYLFGPSRNPFKPVKNTGGSSGGSAAAVADGLVPLAEGTDGGGSIRIPSSWCGVYGYKASFGRVPMVSRPNAFGTTMPFVFEGPITRNVEDAAIALTSLAGYNSRDPFCLEETVDFVPATRQSIRGWKIAYSPNWDVFPVETPVRAVVDKPLRAFSEAGAYVEEVKVGIKRPQKELSDVWCRMCMLGELEAIEDLKRHGFDILKDHRDDLPPLFHHWAEVSGRMTATEYLHDQEIRTEVLDAVRTVLDNYRLLVTPTLACVAVDNSEDGDTKGPSRINGEEVDPLIGWCLTYPVNFTGNPAASIPAGLSDDNLPIGMQIIGRRYADADVLAASAAFERLRPWGHTYQICAQRAL